ncbi:MAG TPA: hypothetical protein VK143_01770 [Burkholderiales bacterium]|nr:hypothetical protein [Burkholderiales bacterium]
MSVRDIIVSVIVLGMFFWTPVMSRHLLRKYNTKLLGEELALIGLPIIAAVGFYKQDWETAMFGLTASTGYFLGLWYVRKKKVKTTSSSYYTLTPDSARNEPSDFLVKAMNDCRPDSGAYTAAKTELDRRADVAKNWRRVGIAVAVGLIGFAFWWLRG